MSGLWEWLDNVSLSAFVIAATAILAISWLVYEIHRAPVMEEEELVRPARKVANRQIPDRLP